MKGMFGLILAGILLLSCVSGQITGAAIVIDADYVTVFPGEEGSIDIDVENTNNYEIQDISVSVVLDGLPFTSVGSSQKDIDAAEWGSLGRVRFLLSSRGSKVLATSGLGNTVYNTIIAGMEAYTTIGLEKANASFIYHDKRSAGGPLELNSTGGWKMSHAQAITNDAWIANLKSTI